MDRGDGFKDKVFLSAGHKVGFISPFWANKSIFCPPSKKNRVYDMGKRLILLV